MSRLLGFLLIGTMLVGGLASCSAVPDERAEVAGELPGVERQALTSCVSDADCAYAMPTSTNWTPIYYGEHCGFDGRCHTDAEEPTCGLWTGTYPDCNFYPGDCRVSHCAYPATCSDGFCVLAGGINPCSPYAYSDPCISECQDNSDCESEYVCESSPGGNVCG